MKEQIARSIAGVTTGTPLTPAAIRATREIYGPFHEREPYPEIGVFRDQPYGAHPRQRFDVFAPDGIAEPRPVVVFVHGGGFVGGERRSAGTPYYDNVGVWAARSGFVGVTMSYRLAPENRFPSGADDVAAAVAAVTETIAVHGGDPAGIVLLGQSAGATHVASYAARHGTANDVRAVALLSGIYDLGTFGLGPNERAYFGDDPSAAAAASPLNGLVASKLPVLLSVSEFDTPAFHEQAWRLAAALYERDGSVPNLLYLPRHNHISQVVHLNAADIEDRLLADRLAEFVRVYTTPAVPAF